MTVGNPLSDSQSSGSVPLTRDVEAAFRDVHEHLRAAQQAADDVNRAREAGVERGLEALGSEALWLEPDSLVRFEWDTADPPAYGARLTSETDELEAALGEFLDGGDLPAGLPSKVRRMDASTGEIDAWDVEEDLRRVQAEFIRTKGEQVPHLRTLRSELDSSWQHAVEVLRGWVREPTRTAPEDWGRVQFAWRAALGLPGNMAAQILGVSPPAVTRYEKGSRSPSLAYIESMVERIVSHGAEPSQQASAVFRIADTFGESTAEFLESSEANAAHEHEVRESVTSLLDSLPIDDVKLLAAVATSRNAMSALRSLSVEDQLAPLRQALSALRRLEA